MFWETLGTNQWKTILSDPPCNRASFDARSANIKHHNTSQLVVLISMLSARLVLTWLAPCPLPHGSVAGLCLNRGQGILNRGYGQPEIRWEWPVAESHTENKSTHYFRVFLCANVTVYRALKTKRHKKAWKRHNIPVLTRDFCVWPQIHFLTSPEGVFLTTIFCVSWHNICVLTHYRNPNILC